MLRIFSMSPIMVSSLAAQPLLSLVLPAICGVRIQTPSF